MTGEDLATLRFLLIYPILLVFGTTWGFMFWRRWRRARYVSDGWAAVLGWSVAIWAGLGLSALYVAKIVQGTYGFLTSGLFTIGAIAVCIIMVSGVVALFGAGWKNEGKGKSK